MDNLPHGVGLLKDLRVVPFVQNLFRPIRLFPVIDEVVTQRCDVTVALYFRVQHFDSINLDFARDRIAVASSHLIHRRVSPSMDRSR